MPGKLAIKILDSRIQSPVDKVHGALDKNSSFKSQHRNVYTKYKSLLFEPKRGTQKGTNLYTKYKSFCLNQKEDKLTN